MSLWWLVPLSFSVVGLVDLLARFKAAWDEADYVDMDPCRWSNYADYGLTHGVRGSTEVDLEADYLLDTTD
jgi:hypothetical protein